MKIQRNFSCFTMICFLVLSISCSRRADKLVVVEKNELFGYTDEKGDTIIECSYPLAFTDTISQLGFVADDKGNIRCFSNEGEFLFNTFNYDNGPDFPQEGLFRIVGQDGLIGFADTLGNIVIEPTYKFAYPFSGGRAKVTDTGREVVNGEHRAWESDNWYFISKENERL